MSILIGQKFVENAKNGQLWQVFSNLKLAVKKVLPDRKKIGEKCQNWKNVTFWVIFKHCVGVRILQHLGLTSINLTELWKFTYFSPFEILSVCKNS